MQLSDAKTITEQLMLSMRPFCERVIVAGSIRRQKPEVKDIELLAIPRFEAVEVPDGFFTKTVDVNLLYRWASVIGGPCGIQWIKPGTDEILPWHVKENGKYWRGYLPHDDIKVDLFLAGPANWGVIQIIRTGSADFSQAVAAHALRRGMRFEKGYLLGTDGERITTVTEEIVFQQLGLHYVRPEDRTGPEAVKVIRRFEPQAEEALCQR